MENHHREMHNNFLVEPSYARRSGEILIITIPSSGRYTYIAIDDDQFEARAIITNCKPRRINYFPLVVSLSSLSGRRRIYWKRLFSSLAAAAEMVSG